LCSPDTCSTPCSWRSPGTLPIRRLPAGGTPELYTKESLPQAMKTVEMLKREGLRQDLRIMLGGWAVTPEFADKAGVDILAVTVDEAVELCLAAMES